LQKGGGFLFYGGIFMQFEYFVENYRRQCENIAQRIDFMDMAE
jgi:hypothetical protein